MLVERAAMNEFRSLLRPFSTGGAMEHFDMRQEVTTDY